MIQAAGIAIAAVVLLFVGRLALQSSKLETALDRARQEGEFEPLVEAIQEAPADKRPTHWNWALDQLWQSYAREEAAELVVVAARESDATVLQYWIRQVLEVEPDIASRVFTEEFLEEHFDRDVASRCGPSGCCG